MKKTLLTLALLVSFTSLVFADDEIDALTATCAACHGPDGNSFFGAWPKLAGQGSNYLFKQIIEIRDGKREVPEMVGMVDHFSDTDARKVASYYALGTTSEGAGEVTELGETLYKAGNISKGITACAACHMSGGQGNAPASFPKVAGQQFDYLVNQLTKFRDASRSNDPNKMMQLIAEKLSDEEIEALANYMASLKP